MVVDKILVFALIAWNFGSGVSTGNNWSLEACPQLKMKDVTTIEERRDSSNHSTIKNSKTNKTLTTCLSLCCDYDEARSDRRCVKDAITDPDSSPRIKILTGNENGTEISIKNFNLILKQDPCDFDWMLPSVLNDFFLLENGSILGTGSDNESLWDFEHYCVFRDPGSVIYSAKVCHPWIREGNFEVCCSIIVILIMLSIFIVYTVVPELKNLHGMIFRSYLATYLGAAACLVGMELTTESRTNAVWYTFFESTARYWGFSTLLWLNVMSFNMWRSFRDMRSIDSNSREREKRKFIWYAIYGWVVPAIFFTSLISAVYYVPYFRNEAVGHYIKIWGSVGPIIFIYLSNVVLYLSTALKIRAYKKDTAYLVDGINRHQAIAEQWFNLHVKLFLIMGGHVITWVVWLLWLIPIITHIITAFEVGQVILIFKTFVWKDKIKKSFSIQLINFFRTIVNKLRTRIMREEV